MCHGRVPGPLPLLGQHNLILYVGRMGQERVVATGGERGERWTEGPGLRGTIAHIWRAMVNRLNGERNCVKITCITN